MHLQWIGGKRMVGLGPGWWEFRARWTHTWRGMDGSILKQKHQHRRAEGGWRARHSCDAGVRQLQHSLPSPRACCTCRPCTGIPRQPVLSVTAHSMFGVKAANVIIMFPGRGCSGRKQPPKALFIEWDRSLLSCGPFHMKYERAARAPRNRGKLRVTRWCARGPSLRDTT